MARRSTRITEMKEKTELSCMTGLFSIIESRQSRASPKMISDGGQLRKHAFDSSMKLQQTASFDAECRKIQNEASTDASAKSIKNLIQEDMSFAKHKNKQIIVKSQKHSKTDSEIFDHIIKTRKRSRKNSQKDLSSAIFHPPSTSSDISLNKLTISAILRAVCDQNLHEENRLSEGFRRSIHPGKYNGVDEINMRQVQMSAKAFVDQMFIDRKFKEGTRSECKPFSNALEVLNSNKDLFMNLLREPDSFLVKYIKNLQNSQRKKETIESVLDVSECKSKEGSDSEVTIHALTSTRRRKTSNQSRISLTTDPSNKIVILKPGLENTKKCSENVMCHCSSLAHKRLGERSRGVKPSSFSLGEIKKKLKFTFGSNKNEPNRFLSDSDGNRPCPERGTLTDDESMSSFHSSDNGKTKEKLDKKEDAKSHTRLDVDMVRKKLDYSSVKYPKKQEFDVILEAKKHLSARLKNLNAVESSTGKRSAKTLERILSSPEHDFLPLSPRRDSLYGSGSVQMRFNPYGTSTNWKQRTCLSPLRQNKENVILRTEQAPDIAANDMKSKGESKIGETKDFIRPPAEVSSETQSPEISITRQSIDTSEIHEDGSTLHSTLDSLSENETSACATDDFPSTPSSIYRLDMVDNMKYHEEHQSPVSVLEPCFSEDSNSPPNISFQTAGQLIQPHRFEFDDCSDDPFSRDLPNSCTEEQDYISHYVHSILKASCLNWDEISEIRPPQETLLHASLFDEVEFQATGIYFDPKLLFDHINQVLQETYQYGFCNPRWLSKTRSVPLEKQVLDEILKEADFYLLPRTEKRTLDQLVSKDVKGCRSWLDVRNDTEEIVVDVVEDLVEETIMDLLLEFHS